MSSTGSDGSVFHWEGKLMKSLLASLVLTLVVAVAPAPAQDAAKKSECGMAGLLCPQKGHCEGECRKVCDATGELVLAVRSRIASRMEKEFGQTCACAKDPSVAPCAVCDFLKTRVVIPVLKERIAIRLEHPEAAPTHPAGACTFLKGSPCEGCVEEMTNVLWEKFSVLLFDRIADFKGAVRARVILRLAQSGTPMCECLKGAAPGASCGDASCEAFKKNVVMPLLIHKVEERLKTWDGERTHSVTSGGKEGTIPCTFLKGRVCWTCADEAAGEICAKLSELKASQK
jgi:hypothetical protein